MAGKTILGLKTEHFPALNFESDEEDRFDFEEKTDDQELTFSFHPHTLPCLDISHHHSSSTLNSPRVSSFDDASPMISGFLSNLQDFKLPPPFTGPLYFIPEHIINDFYSEKLDEFAKNSDKEFPLDLNNLHINILAQVSLVKYFKNKSEDLSHYLTEDTANVIDPRIKSLIHFCLSKTDNRQISAYHKINSISEYVKTSTVAPISILFDDFSLPILAHNLCTDLISLFPHHPLLPSLITKFTIIDPTANELLSTIPEEVDDDDDFSDDFFEKLENVKAKPPLIKFEALNLYSHNITNVLDNPQSTSNYLTITVTEPPSMVTFEQHISEGTDGTQLTPNQFKDWITSLPMKNKEPNMIFNSFRKPKSTFQQGEDKFHSLPTGLRDEDEEKEVTSEAILKLLSYKGPMTDLIPELPSFFDPNLFPLYYPLLQLIQADSAVLLRRDLVSPNLLSIEFEAHKMLTTEHFDQIQKCIDELISILNIKTSLRRKSEASESSDFDGDETSQPIGIARLDQKRKPPTHETPFPLSTVSLLALCDIEFIINGRSPLTLSHNLRHAQISLTLKRQERADLLYDLYTRDVYPPYFSFRAAVAIATNLADSNTSLAADFLFEGLYVLLTTYPQMLHLDFTRNAILFFAELLEKLDSYYYASLLLDILYLANPDDTKYSNAIALLCQKNLDVVRTIFHYTQSMIGFVKSIKCDEALYVAQMISSIYTEYANTDNPISILSCLLQNTYEFTLNDSNPQNKKPPSPTKNANSNQFKPQADLLNTILTGTSLCELLVKTKRFKLASTLLSKLRRSTENLMSSKLLDYIYNKMLVKMNYFKNFIKNLQDIEIKARRNSPSTRLSVLAAANFDSSLATIRILMNSYSNRHLFKQALIWSEIYINSQPKFAMKDTGYGFLVRGYALYQAVRYSHAIVPSSTLYTSLNSLSNKIAGYVDDAGEIKDQEAIFTEALSSLKASQICMDKVGSQKHLSYAYLLYADLLLMYYFDSTFENQTKEVEAKPEPILESISESEDIDFQSETSDEINAKSITISKPFLRIKCKDFLVNTSVTFSPYTIDQNSVIDDLRGIFRIIDRIVTKCMNPVYIIYYQVLLSKFLFMQKKIAESKTTFDYVVSNLKKYFFCGDEIVCRDLNLSCINVLLNSISNLCILLLFYDKQFINDRLICFDWQKCIYSLFTQTLTVKTPENAQVIESTLNISMQSLRSMSPLKSNDFFETLLNNGIDLNQFQSLKKSNAQTIPQCLSRINANVRLYELSKMSEDEMHTSNRSICKEIEQIAEDYHSKNSRTTFDMTYSFVSRTIQMVPHIIFLYRIFNSIYIYRPSTGVKKRIQLVSTPNNSNINENSLTISVPTSSSKGELHFSSTNQNLFDLKFIEIVTMFLMCDKKLHHDNYNSRVARKLCLDAKETLFGDMLNDLAKNENIPDNHFLGENRLLGKGLKGALFSLQPAKQPAIFITSNDLSALPLELMLPDNLVLRSISYTHILLKEPEEASKAPFPNPVVCRIKNDPDHLIRVAIKRSSDQISEFIQAIGGTIPINRYIVDNERNYFYPFPLFSSNLMNPYYSSKFPFCSFYDYNTQTNKIIINTNATPKSKDQKSEENNLKSSLFIFTFSDMCEMPLMLDKLMKKYQSAFYMFIPAQFVREAFQQMLLIFDRQQRRMHYVEDHPEDTNLILHAVVSNMPYNFVTLLQGTLIQLLDCPIPLFVPTQ